MSEINQLGKALYNLQRFQILQTKLNPATTDLISDLYAFAWYNNIFPIFDDKALHQDLDIYFEISENQVNEISDWADSEWLKGNLYTFDDYVDYFATSNKKELKVDKYVLVSVFRYFYLRGGFDDLFWDKLVEETLQLGIAKNITDPFNIEEININ